MPIIKVTGLTNYDIARKLVMRKSIQGVVTLMLSEYGVKDLVPEDTKVTFISDPTEPETSPVIAQIVSQYMEKISQEQRDEICDKVIGALEAAGRPYNEAYPVAVLGMRYRNNVRLR